MFHKRVVFNGGGGGEGNILQLCSRAPKLMTHLAPRVYDLLDTPLDNNMVSKILMGMSSTNIHLLQYKIQSHFENVDFECRNIRTQSEETPSKICNITFTVLTFPYQNTLTKLPS